MGEFVQKCWRFILTWFWHEKPIAPKIKRQKSKRVDVDGLGSWYYLGDLLNDLDNYSVYMKEMKAQDSVAYDIFSQVGGVVIAPGSRIEHTELPAAWRHGYRPSFGLSMMPERLYDKDPERMVPVFFYYYKTNHFKNYAAFNGDIYEVCFAFPQEEHRRLGVNLVTSYRVGIDSQGNTKVLKVRKVVKRPIPRNSQVTVPSVVWEYPRNLLIWAQDKEMSPEEMGTANFFIAASVCSQISQGMLVRATKGGITSAFVVDMLRTPYFFKDRNSRALVNGRKRKILHIVRTHQRKLAGGKAANVKSHFRGERKFNWHGYDVTISMPGKHHHDIQTFDPRLYSVDEDDLPSIEFIEPKDAARVISQHLSQ